MEAVEKGAEDDVIVMVNRVGRWVLGGNERWYCKGEESEAADKVGEGLLFTLVLYYE